MVPLGDSRNPAPPPIEASLYGENSRRLNAGEGKKRRRRSNAELSTVEAPQLRIVPEELWSAVQERFQANRRTSDHYRKRGMVKHRLAVSLERSRPCGHCGGPIEALSRDYQRRKGRVCGCAYHRKRGSSIYENALRMDQDQIDDALLHAIGDH